MSLKQNLWFLTLASCLVMVTSGAMATGEPFESGYGAYKYHNTDAGYTQTEQSYTSGRAIVASKSYVDANDDKLKHDIETVQASIPAAQQAANWDATSGVTQITNKPTITNAASDITGAEDTDTKELPTTYAVQQYAAPKTTAVTHTANTAAGSATQPVYIDQNGVATATTYTLGSSVPANAVFTDTKSNWDAQAGTDAEILNKPTITNAASDITGAEDTDTKELPTTYAVQQYAAPKTTAVTHTANTAAGSATQPVYIDQNGVATATTYTLGSSVPADAEFTDTTYTDFTGVSSSQTTGSAGLVPEPDTFAQKGDYKYLQGSGNWDYVKVPVTTSGEPASNNLPSSLASVWVQ